MTFSNWGRGFFFSLLPEKSGLCDLINWSHYRATDRQTYWWLPVGIWAEMWRRRGEQMEWGNRVMDGPLPQGPAGREQVMSVPAKLRKIRVSAVGKVTASISLFITARMSLVG